MMMIEDPILIGPTGVGKTTAGRILASFLEQPLVSLDEIRFSYHREIAYDEERAGELKVSDYEGLLRYWEPFSAYAVGRCLEDHRDCVFDFGAIHSVFDDQSLFAQVKHRLERYSNVFLLLPYDDADASVKYLHERGKAESPLDDKALNMWWRIIERFVKSPCNSLLATQTIYIAGTTPEEVGSNMLACLRARKLAE